MTWLDEVEARVQNDAAELERLSHTDVPKLTRALREAIPYMRHKDGCKFGQQGNDDWCTCGLTDLLARVERGEL